jgi:hypothetical protein
MRTRIGRTTIVVPFLLSLVSATVLTEGYLQREVAAKSSSPMIQKKPRDIAKDRDWEIKGTTESSGEYVTFESLIAEAHVIVHGRIITSRSFWDESGHPIDHGENITTEYIVDVYRVLKDGTKKLKLRENAARPAPVSPAVKIARNGGVVYENGHRAAIEVEGYEVLKEGGEYVFFLHWSRAYEAYVFAGRTSGVMTVGESQKLTSLAKSKEIQEKLDGISLHNLLDELSRLKP